MLKIAVLLVTHNRIVDAKIAMEIIKNIWPIETVLKSTDIYHAYNGDMDKYPKKYLEKKLIRRVNMGHFEGAGDLIDNGIKAIFESKIMYDFIMVMSGDVWLIKPKKIAKLIQQMVKNDYLLAGTLWPSFYFVPKYLATEFFIIQPKLAKKIFPLNVGIFFMRRKLDNFLHKATLPIKLITVPKLEMAFTHKVLESLKLSFLSFQWRRPGQYSL